MAAPPPLHGARPRKRAAPPPSADAHAQRRSGGHSSSDEISNHILRDRQIGITAVGATNLGMPLPDDSPSAEDEALPRDSPPPKAQRSHFASPAHALPPRPVASAPRRTVSTQAPTTPLRAPHTAKSRTRIPLDSDSDATPPQRVLVGFGPSVSYVDIARVARTCAAYGFECRARRGDPAGTTHYVCDTETKANACRRRIERAKRAGEGKWLGHEVPEVVSVWRFRIEVVHCLREARATEQ